MQVSVGVSNHHVHLTKHDADILFGSNYEFNKKSDLKQPGQYCTYETVTLMTDKNKIENVRIILPFRDYTQVEISKTDAYNLGINPPIRDAGDIENSESITIIGPKNKLFLHDGCIIANRHIHMLPSQAKLYGMDNLDEVLVDIGGVKGAILKKVKLRVSDNSYLELHLDTDDANSNFLKNGDVVTIIKPR